MTVCILILLPLCLVFGSVEIPLADVFNSLFGGEVSRESWKIIVIEARLPMALTALLAGSALSVAGLLLQTCFDNPLAGPSILGVSTGSSLGVALVLLVFGGSVGFGWSMYLCTLTGALAGAAVVLFVILLFSRVVHNSVMLLIVGILIGYFASSAIALLNFFATQEGVYSFIIWGLGSYSGLSLGRVAVFAAVTLPVIIASSLFIKPLNALLLGRRYAESMGINVRSVRTWLIVVSGALTAFVTAFCGPIGFLGLIVPHIARMAVRTSNHAVLLPATALAGGALSLLCALISVLPMTGGVIPINAITPIIGVPIVIYVIVNRKKLLYFN